MQLTITIPEETQSILELRAKAHGYTNLSQYVEKLILMDLAISKSFDEILFPIRQYFSHSEETIEEWDLLCEEAREEEVYQAEKQKTMDFS